MTSVNINSQWTDSDSSFAMAQGWNLFQVSLKGQPALLIEKCDEQDIFAGDDDAVAFVQSEAKKGCVIACKALSLDAELTPA